MASKAATPKEFGDFLSRYGAQQSQNLRQLTTFKDQLLRLDRDYRDLCQELAKERAAKQSIQDKSKHQIKTLESVVAAHDKAVRDGAFVLVLVDADGDGYLMHNYLQQDAVEGGSRAAKELREAIREHLLASYGDQEASLPVVAKAFASGHGRVNLLERATGMKRHDAQKNFMSFMSGFSQAEELFDFVVVDKGKERADRKLEASFRHFIKNPCCQRILLASCHDNGYVRMLEKFVDDPVASKKIVLVKSSQTGAEFTPLPFASTTLGGFFKQQRSSSPPPPPTAAVPTAAPAAAPAAVPAAIPVAAPDPAAAAAAAPVTAPSSKRPGLVIPAVVTASSVAAATLSVPNKAADAAAPTTSSPTSPTGPEPVSRTEPRRKSVSWLSNLLGLSSSSSSSEKPEAVPAAPASVPVSVPVPDPVTVPASVPVADTVPTSIPASAPVPVPAALEPSTPPPPVYVAEAHPLWHPSFLPSTPPATPPSQKAQPRTPSPSSRSPPPSGPTARAVPKFGTFPEGSILVNAQKQRIDAPLPSVPEAARKSMREKQKARQFCYQQQLQTSCFRANCQFSHEKLSADELMYLRRQSRSRKCTKESKCRDARCIYGHSCTCSQKECLFGPGLHKLDTSTWTYVEIIV